MSHLSGKRVLAVMTNYGVEQDEIVVPVEHLREAGAEVTVAASELAPIRTLTGDKEPGRTTDADQALDDVDPAGYDLLLVPGGTINADTLRRQDAALSLTKAFIASGRPIAAICHGPWLLVEADAVGGKRLTSYPSLQTDVRNAGGTWVDQEVVRDDAEGWTLITSRNPGDLPAFCDAIDAALQE